MQSQENNQWQDGEMLWNKLVPVISQDIIVSLLFKRCAMIKMSENNNIQHPKGMISLTFSILGLVLF